MVSGSCRARAVYQQDFWFLKKYDRNLVKEKNWKTRGGGLHIQKFNPIFPFLPATVSQRSPCPGASELKFCSEEGLRQGKPRCTENWGLQDFQNCHFGLPVLLTRNSLAQSKAHSPKFFRVSQMSIEFLAGEVTVFKLQSSDFFINQSEEWSETAWETMTVTLYSRSFSR